MRKTFANGDFDRRITVQQRAVSIDAYGGQVEAYATVGTLYAKYVPQPMTGVALAEMADQPQFLEKASFIVRTPRSFNIDTDSRIVFGGNIWKIIGMASNGVRDEYTAINAVKTDSTLFGDTAVDATIGTTGKTLTELIDYYIAQNTVAPRIAYPNIIHMDDIDDVGVETWGPNGYQAMLSSGALSPGPAPSNILHIAEVDTVSDPQYLKTLVNNNEFGNKHRFTYDDGTEATEMYTNSPLVADGGNATVGPGLDGYTGSNPRYIIDHYTGLGWYRSDYSHNLSTWYEARGLYGFYTSLQDWVDKPSTFTYAGFSDWRRPTGPEWLFSLGTVDWSSYMTGNDQSDRDIYFPPLNQFIRGYGGLVLLLGPTDVSNESVSADFNWFVPASQTNGGILTGVAQATMENQITAQNNSTYTTFMCRRHYDNR